MVTIEIRFHDGRTERRQLADGVHVVGREAGDIILGDPQVSGSHAKLSVSGGRVSYLDEGSTNGSYDAQGQRVSGSLDLASGGLVRLGQSQISVLSTGANADRAAAAAGRTQLMGSALPTPPAPAPHSPAAGAAGSAPQHAPRTPLAPSPPRAAARPVASPAAPAAPQSPSSQPAPAQPAAVPDLSPQAAAQPASPPQPAPPPQQPAMPDPVDAAPHVAAQAPAAPVDAWALSSQETSGPDAAAAIQPSPDQPFGQPVGVAGERMDKWTDQFRSRLKYIWALYEPHWKPLAMLVGSVTVPFALLHIVLGFFPLVGLMLALPLAIAEPVILYLFVMGAVYQYAVAVHRGETPDARAALRAHMPQTLSWAFSMFLAGIPGVLMTLCIVSIILSPLALPLAVIAVMMEWAAGAGFVIDGKRGAEPALYSFRLMKADWRHGMTALAIVVLPFIPLWLASSVIATLPGLSILSPLWSALVTAFMLPFVILYTIALFHETKQRVSNAGKSV